MDAEELVNRYRSRGLDEGDLLPDPVELLKSWLAVAEAEHCAQPTAMALATADKSGHVGVRAVLCRGITENSLHFYSNYASPKNVALHENPHCSVLFAWLEIERQVRVTGVASEASSEQSDAYWSTRPRMSQISSSASKQSAPLDDHGEFDRRVAALEEKYEGVDVPRPDYWGGMSIEVQSIEFWQGRAARMHDRFRYDRTQDGWTIQRLYP